MSKITCDKTTLLNRQIKIIGNSLGVNVLHCNNSKYKKDKSLPSKFYRNYFCAGNSFHRDFGVLEQIEKLGWAERYIHPINQIYFFITERGKEVFREWFVDNIKYYSPSKRKYQKYLQSDCGLSFPQWLGIQQPFVDINFCSDPPLYRYSSVKYFTITGEWNKIKKDAKASYKIELYKHLNKLRGDKS